jgi:hypothetical protein
MNINQADDISVPNPVTCVCVCVCLSVCLSVVFMHVDLKKCRYT